METSNEQLREAYDRARVLSVQLANITNDALNFQRRLYSADPEYATVLRAQADAMDRLAAHRRYMADLIGEPEPTDDDGSVTAHYPYDRIRESGG